MSDINQNPVDENATKEVAESTKNEVETTNTVETENPVTENEAAIAPATSVETETKSETKSETTSVEEEKVEEPVKEKYVDVDHKIKVFALSLEKIVAERATTNMGPLTEKELLATLGDNLRGVTVAVHRNTENKEEGYINFTEFGKTVRVPEEGFFTFGIDYSAPAQ